MKKTVSLFLASLIICLMSGALLADEPGDEPGSSGEGVSVDFHFSAAMGIMFFGEPGPRRIKTDRYIIDLKRQSFSGGFSGGIELYLAFNVAHTLSLGAYYEDRKATIEVTDLLFYTMLSPFGPAGMLYPWDRFSSESSLSMQYFSFPVTYRYWFTRNFYLGGAMDIAMAHHSSVDYRVLAFEESLDIKDHLSPFDLGLRGIMGLVMNRVIIELSVGTGLLDFDRFGGVRHSAYMKIMFGYYF